MREEVSCGHTGRCVMEVSHELDHFGNHVVA